MAGPDMINAGEKGVNAMSDEKNTSIPEGKKEFLRRLSQASELYVLISLCTREPYVVCNPETYDDQILIFLDGEEAKKESVRLLEEEKKPVNVAKLETKQMLMFFTSLYTMGVNAIMIKNKEEESLLQIDEIVKRKDQKEMPDGTVWIENPQLHLTALYYTQELRRPGTKDPETMRELQEEIGAHFTKATLIVSAPQEDKGVPLIKLDDDKTYQPVFTDVLEFQKFNRQNQFRPVAVTADKLVKIIPEGTTGVVLNPMGLKLPMTVKKNEPPKQQKPV